VTDLHSERKRLITTTTPHPARLSEEKFIVAQFLFAHTCHLLQGLKMEIPVGWALRAVSFLVW
jgi:hypothetical protein